jgi:DNA-directed RNA polymerase specialized sigma24 family protein
MFVVSKCLTQNFNVMNLSEIYTKHRNEIFNYVYFKYRNKQVAEEIANDVFIKFSKANYNSELSAIPTFLRNIADNLIIDYWRKMRVESGKSYYSLFFA